MLYSKPSIACTYINSMPNIARITLAYCILKYTLHCNGCTDPQPFVILERQVEKKWKEGSNIPADL